MSDLRDVGEGGACRCYTWPRPTRRWPRWGVEPGYPCAPAAPLTPRAAVSPLWLRLLGAAAQGRRGKAIGLEARPAAEGEVSVEQRLGQIVRALTVLVATVRGRGLERWLEVDGSGFARSNEAGKAEAR
ncbi:MAG: hypothetical protein ABI629_08820 [bacterium]